MGVFDNEWEEWSVNVELRPKVTFWVDVEQEIVLGRLGNEGFVMDLWVAQFGLRLVSISR